MELKELLAWFTTVGAGALAYWLEENIVWFSGLSSWQKRVAAYALAFVLADIGWLFSILMLYTPQPETWRAWVEGAVLVGTTAFGFSQIVHGITVLRKKAVALKG